MLSPYVSTFFLIWRAREQQKQQKQQRAQSSAAILSQSAITRTVQ